MSSNDSTIYPGVATVKGALKQLEKLEEDHEIHAPFGGVQNFKGMTCNASTPEISKPQAGQPPVGRWALRRRWRFLDNLLK